MAVKQAVQGDVIINFPHDIGMSKKKGKRDKGRNLDSPPPWLA